MARDPRRAIPAVAVPSLTELGLDDLQRVRRGTRRLFLVRPLLAGGVAVWATRTGYVFVALAAVPLLYGWSLTLVHHMIHGSLQASRSTRQAALAIGGILALHSGHALTATHLQHHRTELDADDPEGEIEQVPWRRMPVEAVMFRYRLWAWAWRNSAHSQRTWIAAEVAVHVLAMAWAMTHTGQGLARVIVAIWFADAVFAVLAGKGPQTNWGKLSPTPLIAIRSRYLRWLLLAHNWHLEHHLYPHIPLPYLARVVPALEGLLTQRGEPVLVKGLP